MENPISRIASLKDMLTLEAIESYQTSCRSFIVNPTTPKSLQHYAQSILHDVWLTAVASPSES